MACSVGSTVSVYANAGGCRVQLPSSVPDAKAALVEAGTAKVLGFTAVVVCVDDPTTGTLPCMHTVSYVLENRVTPSLVHLAAWGWDEIQQLTAAASLPVVVKGVTSTADARDAVAAGCAAVCVCCADSDSCRSAAVLRLASVVDAVGDQVPVLFDGGVQRGTDAFKVCSPLARRAGSEARTHTRLVPSIHFLRRWLLEPQLCLSGDRACGVKSVP